MHYFHAFSAVPPHIVVELGLKLRKSLNFTHLLNKPSSFLKLNIKWQWITSGENHVETVQINTATQQTCEHSVLTLYKERPNSKYILMKDEQYCNTYKEKVLLPGNALIAWCSCLNWTRAYERPLSYRQLRALTFP